MANGWNRYEKLVLHEIQENGKRFEAIGKTLAQLSGEVATLKVKAAVAGGMAGMVGTGLVSALLSFWK